MLREAKLDTIIPDNQFRRRDPRFPTVKKDYSGKRKFTKVDFIYDEKKDEYTCPHGKKLPYYSRSTAGTFRGIKYRASSNDCADCPLQKKCLSKGSSRRYLFIATSNTAQMLIPALSKSLFPHSFCLKTA